MGFFMSKEAKQINQILKLPLSLESLRSDDIIRCIKQPEFCYFEYKGEFFLVEKKLMRLKFFQVIDTKLINEKTPTVLIKMGDDKYWFSLDGFIHG